LPISVSRHEEIGGRHRLTADPRQAKKDYALLPAGLPAAFASLDTGHGGTFAATNGGKAAIAAVNYLEWQMRGNASAKAMWLEPKGANGLTTQGFPEVMTKNW